MKPAIKILSALLVAGALTTLPGCSGMLDIPSNFPFVTNIMLLFGSVPRLGPGITIGSSIGGYAVSENPTLGSLTLTVVLDAAPDSNVTVPVSMGMGARAFISTPASQSLTFTPGNWSTPQNVVITGIDNVIVDGNQDTQFVLGAASSGDPDYNTLVAPSVGVIVMDDEGYSIVLSPATGLITRETGTTAKFTVVLSKAPSVNVNVPTIVSNDTTEGTVSVASLTFTPANFKTPQAVTVTGVDDPTLDGNVNYTVTLGNSTSGDVNYSNKAYYTYQNPSLTNTVSLTTIDNEVPAVVVTPTVLNLTEGGTVGTFSVYLSVQPTGNVTISLTSGDPARASLDKASLTFTTANYGTPQVVTVTPVNNSVADGVIPPITVTTGIATNFGNVDPADVIVNITDDDTPGITVSNLSRNTNEAGQNATFTVRLTSLPSANVTVTINERNDPKNSANQEGTVDKTSLTFTPGNWNVNQTVTVTGVNDFVMDGNVQYIILLENAISADPSYSGMKPADVTVNNNDDDTAGFVILANSVTTNTSNSAVTISGFATDDMANLDPLVYSMFTIKLRSQPLVNVTLNLSSSSSTNDGTLSTTSLLFTTANWNVAQQVYVTGASNGANEGNHDYSINVAIFTTDDKYGNTTFVKAPAFTMHSCDNDAANLISACRRSGSFSTTEPGGTATVYVITKSNPGGAVSVPAASSNTAEGTVSTPATISAGNWNTMLGAGTNKIVATGVDDLLVDGNVLYTIQLNTSSGMITYDPPDVSLRNIDNEQVLVVGNQVGNTTESGGTATFGVKLAAPTAPTSDVTVSIACQTGSQECAGVSPATLTFTAGNYNTYQTITITGKSDSRVDGDSANCVSFGALVSVDEFYNDYQAPDSCPVNNVDRDRLIWTTTVTKNGNLNAGMTIADSNCNDGADPNKPTDMGAATYKALMVDSTTRIATTTGTNATGQLNWVLTPGTSYYLKSGSKPYSSLIMTTNAYGFFSFGNLTTKISSNGADQFWTGLMSDWRTSADTCSNWTNDVGFNGQYGIGNVTNATSVSSSTDSCLNLKKIICVQQ